MFIFLLYHYEWPQDPCFLASQSVGHQITHIIIYIIYDKLIGGYLILSYFYSCSVRSKEMEYILVHYGMSEMAVILWMALSHALNQKIVLFQF